MQEQILVAPLVSIAALIIGIAIGWWLRTKNTSGDSQKIENLESELQLAREAKIVAETNITNMTERLAEEKSRLEEMKQSMETSFKAIAADITNTNSKTFLESVTEYFKFQKAESEQQLDAKKQLIDKSLKTISERLDSMQNQSTELKSSIDAGEKTTAELNKTATRLREVLSSSQKRGQWGERMVEDILQYVGLKENVNYTKHSQVESGDIPDYTFLLPQEKKLNMDVKFPLDSYEKYINNANQESGAAEKKAFLKAVRGHIDTVCKRGYINPSEGTLNYVMLFIPNESIYSFIDEENAQLIDYALGKNVLLCSPLTLYAMLSLIHQAARNFAMNERASEVMELVNQFRTQWEKYDEQMNKLGRRIDGLTTDFKELTQTRTRALEKPLDKIDNIALSSDDNAPPSITNLPPADDL